MIYYTDPCRCCPGQHGDGACSYHKNKTRRFQQREDGIIQVGKARNGEEYYCGLCKRMMPIAHFPHS